MGTHEREPAAATGSGAPSGASGGSAPAQGVVSPAATLDLFIVRKLCSSPTVVLPQGAFGYIRRMSPRGSIYRMTVGASGAVTASHQLQGDRWTPVASGITVAQGQAYAVVWQMSGSAPDNSALDGQLVAANAYTPVAADFAQRRLVIGTQIHGAVGQRVHAVYPASAWDMLGGRAIQWQYLMLRRVTLQADIQGSLANNPVAQVGGGPGGAEGQVTAGNLQASGTMQDRDNWSTAEQYSIFKSAVRAADPNSIHGWQLSQVGGLSHAAGPSGGTSANLGLQLSCPGVQFGPDDHPYVTFQANITFDLYERQRDPGALGLGARGPTTGDASAPGDLMSRIGVVLVEIDMAHPFNNVTIPRFAGPPPGEFLAPGAQQGTFAFNGSATLKLIFELVPNWRAIGREIGRAILEAGAEFVVTVLIGVAGAVLTVVMTAFSFADFAAFEDFCAETRKQLYMFCMGYVMGRTGNRLNPGGSGSAWQQARDGVARGEADLQAAVRAHAGASALQTAMAARPRNADDRAYERLYEECFGHVRDHYWQSVLTYCNQHWADDTDFHRQVASGWLDSALPGQPAFDRMNHDPALADIFELVTNAQLQQQIDDETAQRAPASGAPDPNLPPLRVTGTANT